MKLLKLKGVFIVMLLLGIFCMAFEPVSAQGTAEVGFFEDLEIQPDAAFEVPVSVRDVEALYAIDIEIQFDPAVLQVEDASPNQEGVQVGLGTFLDAGLILYNQADNEEGLIRFAMTQLNPSEPKSGEGIVLVLYFVAQGEGETALEVSFAEASTRLGEAIAIEGVDGLVMVSSGAAENQATDIPVQDVAQVTVIPTMAPSPTPTITPTFAPTPTPEISEGQEGQVPGESTEETTMEETAVGEPSENDPAETGASILDYWWVVLIVLAAAGGAAAYLVLSKKKA